MLNADEKEDEPTNIVSLQMQSEELISEEIDNLNTSIKEEREAQNLLKQKIGLKSQKVESENNGQNVKKQNTTTIIENGEIFKIRIQELGAEIPQKEEQRNANEKVEQPNQRQNRQKLKLTKDLKSLNKQTQDNEEEVFSPTKEKLKKKLKSQKSIGYEKYRKGFEAINQGSIDLAKMHNLAKKIKKIDLKEIENNEFCDCCGLPIEGQKYSIKCSIDEFGNFGVGFSLYFIYLKFMVILLSIAFFPFGLTMWILCVFKSNSQKEEITNSSTLQLRSSIEYYINQQENGQLPVYFGILQLLNLLIMIIAVIIFKRYCKKKEFDIDLKLVQPRDYVVWLKNLPNGITKEQLQVFIENQGRADGKKCQVSKILFPVKLQEYMKLVKQYKKYELKKNAIEISRSQDKQDQEICCELCKKQELPPQ